MGVTLDGIAFSGPDFVALLRILRLRMAVNVLRLSTVTAEASAGPSEGSLACIPVFPITYVPGAGRRDKLLLRCTEDDCGSAVVDDVVGELFESEVVTRLRPLAANGSGSPEHRRSDAPARIGSLDGTAILYNDIHTTVKSKIRKLVCKKISSRCP